MGRRLVEHSLHEARRVGIDAMQFNLVFASNPARHMYHALGSQVGRIPAAVDGEDAVIDWRSLERRPVSDVSVDSSGGTRVGGLPASAT